MSRNSPSNAEDLSSIPGQGTKISPAAGQLSPRATTTDALSPRAHAPKQEKITQ